MTDLKVQFFFNNSLVLEITQDQFESLEEVSLLIHKHPTFKLFNQVGFYLKDKRLELVKKMDLQLP
jgi:hypothetical protein